MRLAVVLIVLGIALIAFGILFPNLGKTLYPAGTEFSFSEMGTGGPFINEISIYAGAATTVLGAWWAAICLVRR
jgi:hypothetical protein